MFVTMKNSKLISLLQKGDEKSFTKIFNTYYMSLVAYVNQHTRDMDQAKDIAQMSFISIWEKRNNLEIKTSFKAYLFHVAYNNFIDSYRKDRLHSHYLETLTFESLKGTAEEPIERQKEKLLFLDKVVEELPARCQTIFIMSKKEGLTYKEIGNYLDISPKTVEAQLRIAMTRIRERFKESALVVLITLFYNKLILKSVF